MSKKKLLIIGVAGAYWVATTGLTIISVSDRRYRNLRLPWYQPLVDVVTAPVTFPVHVATEATRWLGDNIGKQGETVRSVLAGIGVIDAPPVAQVAHWPRVDGTDRHLSAV